MSKDKTLSAAYDLLLNIKTPQGKTAHERALKTLIKHFENPFQITCIDTEKRIEDAFSASDTLDYPMMIVVGDCLLKIMANTFVSPETIHRFSLDNITVTEAIILAQTLKTLRNK